MASGLPKALYRKIARGLEHRHRRGIVFRVTDNISARPTLYFLAPDYNLPSGGTMVIYRHVDILNAAGIPAVALHERPGFRYTWFDNLTPVADIGHARFNRNDLLVVPEMDVDLLARLSPGIRHVVFNQSSHLSWKRAPDQVNLHYRNNPDLVAVVAVSAHSQSLLRHAFDNVDIRRIHLGLDDNLFRPDPARRGQRIAYMPRRGRDDAELLLNILTNRGSLSGWDIVPLDGLPHAEIARQLQTTKIFLSFPYQEGFGLPAAEAMACGNYVIGYHGFGGREIFDPSFSAPIETGDILGFAKTVEDALRKERNDPNWCAERGNRASTFMRSQYSLAREASEVAMLYGEFLGQPAREVQTGAVPIGAL